MNSDEILTIICLTFNHANFIHKTLEGFVSQETEYKFKVIVHDDASTDGTQTIIREFEQKYPNLFECIYQSQNAYSKGIDIKHTYIQPLVKSKYIALCEGDDYWCDKTKIQSQLSYLINSPDTAMCVHNTQYIDFDGDLLKKQFNNSSINKDYSFPDVLKAGGGGLFHTSSMIMKTEVYFDIPDYFYLKGVGDYPITLYAASLGDIHYIGKIMSYYRSNNPNSWIGRMKQNVKLYANHYYDEYLFLENIEKNINSFHHAFKIAKGRCIYSIIRYKECPRNYGLKLTKYIFILSYLIYRIGNEIKNTINR